MANTTQSHMEERQQREETDRDKTRAFIQIKQEMGVNKMKHERKWKQNTTFKHNFPTRTSSEPEITQKTITSITP